MPVLNWRSGETGFSDAYIRSRIPKNDVVVSRPRNEWTARVARSSVIVSKKDNPTRSTVRVYRGTFPDWYRPGGVLYRP